MLLIFGIIVFFLLFTFVPFIRFLCFHTHHLIYQFYLSTVDFLKYKRYNECKDFGHINVFTGLFGMGKTKQAVLRVYRIYKRYNNLLVWSPLQHKFINQKIIIYSNVKLSNIPYREFTSMQQMIDVQYLDSDGYVYIFLIDEASVVFNSREYKDNFNTDSLRVILTSRHHKIDLILTSQRFEHLDKLLRDVTTSVFDCKYYPFFHIQRITEYDAWELQCSKNPSLCQPLSVWYEYTSSFVYSLYDTYAMVKNVIKNCEDKKYISDSETLAYRGDNLQDLTQVNRVKPKESNKKVK